MFRKDALRLWSNIFETFRFAPRKISQWKNLFVFQRLMFLYQLVNLVLETCFIFSKTLKLGKTFLSWVSRLSSIIRTTSIMILLFQIIFRNSFQEVVVSWIFGIFTKSIVVSILDFWHISFRKMFELLTCKKNHDFWVSGVMLWIDLKSIDMAEGFYFLLRCLKRRAFFKVGCHVGNVTWLSLPFFLILSLLFWREKKSKSKFWSDWIFFGLGRFSIYRVVGLLKSSFDKRPLNVGRHVENGSLRKE